MIFNVTLYLTATITLTVIMDPTGNIPVFLSLVGRRSRESRNKAARQGVLVSLGVISAFAITQKVLAENSESWLSEVGMLVSRLDLLMTMK